MQFRVEIAEQIHTGKNLKIRLQNQGKLDMRKNKIKVYFHVNILLLELASDKDSPLHPISSPLP
jgi:hypothetical protein